MKKSLKQTEKHLYFYEKGVKKIYKDGDFTGLSGTISSGLSGNCDDCQITQEERKKGVNINDLLI